MELKTHIKDIPLGDKVNETFRYDNLMNSCKENKGLLEVFRIEINYQEYLKKYDEFNLNETQDKIKEMIDQGINDAARSLEIDPKTKDNINQTIDTFSRFTFNRNGSEFEEILNSDI